MTVPEGIDDPYDGPGGGMDWWVIHVGAGVPRPKVCCMPDGGPVFGKAVCNGAIEGNYKTDKSY
ncbi:hypothetical protein HanRHA438_Chr03g0100211 [Helianthus annuus]|nr:hypothetical protein HanIR_Chr12g0613341 [Helianthus annuus]KAJ0933797.1 hypothetical protein HanRHA438_Chr03g0100211 [Helianthus annuus]